MWGGCSSPFVCLSEWKFICNLKLHGAGGGGVNIIHCPVNLIFINNCQLYLPLYIKSKMNNETKLNAKKYKKPIHNIHRICIS